MKDIPLISIIVPAYNAENTLIRCINSILNQNYINFEVLLINDGSFDETKSICDNFVKKDSRIRVFHKLNGGVSSARNLGLDRSVGEYICFVDSDDWIENDYLDNFYTHIKNDESLIIENYTIDTPTHSQKKWSFSSKTFKKEAISDFFIQWDILRNGVSCSKLYSAKIIQSNAIRFHIDVHYAEDCLFMLEFFQYIKEIQYIDYAGYHYVKANPQSLSKSYYSFESEIKGFNLLNQQLIILTRDFLCNNEVKIYINTWLGKFFLRPIQTFYRRKHALTQSARIKLLKQIHTPDKIKYLDNINSLNFPITILFSIFLYKHKQFLLYDSYMELLFKYHRFKINKN